MSYIGNPIVSTDFPKDTFSGNGSTTAFTMSVAPASVNAVVVVVSGVVQDPSTYTVSGTTLTFSAAPPSGTSNISIRHLGVAGSPNVPALGSVVPASINSSYSLWNLSGADINYPAGNVGIGTSSPQARLHQSSTNDGVQAIFTGAQTGTTQTILLRSHYHTNNGTAGFANIGWFDNGSQGGGITFGTTANGSGTTGTPTERMRITSGGGVAVNTTDASNGFFTAYAGSGQGTALCTWVGSSSTQTQINFKNPNGNIGAVTTNGSTTTYSTSSDYRLKDNIAPMTGALTTVSALKPVTYKWKCDGSNGQGFIAHELAEIVPDCVTGEKDAVDAEGNPVYQGIDTSFLVATLVAAIKELNAKVDAQALEIQALKGTV